ncbi:MULTISPECIES: enoyl-CoA hydratase [unclassified Hyphomonas]|jgi:enoyl-CoA hydratase|uniref:enoyl-CoA hydratase n=2 Tax=root TaxID=1 RepID=A0A160U1C2_9ZZZZ|nr:MULTISPECIES: enoyl-CoA hydratase [unclassified Hyphomonas]MAN91031.1 enoyl-CoA hydratase [Hyphomonadaceae bacterium]KCZ65829.1 enoyl-CoA hydratase [Hyphomonas sp. L-53-1-40]MAA82377.1 enoyl-CoA hydratase [Hyphomonas sp.]MAL45088.1 enoyl-CoA hydratase [Hyphomonas sp.]MAX83692.1 enoyl-CoA hydratase [Hyphomonas sp.]|tara:strand:+ start:1233 stop:2015 length:783 start_codon:yes stop_codon:yes gene_type:complete
MSYKTLLTEIDQEAGFAVITLNRAESLNALCEEMMNELTDALDRFEADPDIGCIILTGGKKAFSGGADIKEIQEKTYPESYYEDFISRNWERAARARKPIVAAVSGYAIGGGCELALMCDIILAADTARFGQPEVRLGVMPGAGGTQRLARVIGKSKTMELCLTGRMMEAEEAERCGLVSRVVPADDLMDAARELARTIASMPLAAAMLTKEAIKVAYETPLSQGIQFERRMFQSLFSTDDQKEGMAAYVEKRSAHFKDK